MEGIFFVSRPKDEIVQKQTRCNHPFCVGFQLLHHCRFNVNY